MKQCVHVAVIGAAILWAVGGGSQAIAQDTSVERFNWYPETPFTLGASVHRGNLSPSAIQCVRPSTISDAWAGRDGAQRASVSLSVVVTKNDALRVMGIEARADARYLNVASGSATYSLAEKAQSSGESMTALFEAKIDYPDSRLAPSWELIDKADALAKNPATLDAFRNMCGTHLVVQTTKAVTAVLSVRVASLSAASKRAVAASLTGSYSDAQVSANLSAAFYEELQSRSNRDTLEVELVVNGTRDATGLASSLLDSASFAAGATQGLARADAIKAAVAKHLGEKVDAKSAFESAFWLAPWPALIASMTDISWTRQDEELVNMRNLHRRTLERQKVVAAMLAVDEPRAHLFSGAKRPLRDLRSRLATFRRTIEEKHSACKRNVAQCNSDALTDQELDLRGAMPTFPGQPVVSFELFVDGAPLDIEKQKVVLASMDGTDLLARTRAAVPSASRAELYAVVRAADADPQWTAPYALRLVRPIMFATESIPGLPAAEKLQGGIFRQLLECEPCATGVIPVNPRARLEDRARNHPTEDPPGREALKGGNVSIVIEDSTGLSYEWGIAGVSWMSVPKSARSINYSGYYLTAEASYRGDLTPKVRRCGAGELPDCR